MLWLPVCVNCVTAFSVDLQNLRFGCFHKDWDMSESDSGNFDTLGMQKSHPTLFLILPAFLLMEVSAPLWLFSLLWVWWWFFFV